MRGSGTDGGIERWKRKKKCKRGTGDAESRKKFKRVGGEPLDTGEKKNPSDRKR